MKALKFPVKENDRSTPRKELNFSLHGFDDSTSDIGHDMNEVQILDSTYGEEEEFDDDKFVDDERVALYQRLHDLEEITRSFLKPRSKVLEPGMGSFSELDVEESAEFELSLESFGTNDVLCLVVIASRDYMSGKNERNNMHTHIHTYIHTYIHKYIYA